MFQDLKQALFRFDNRNRKYTFTIANNGENGGSDRHVSIWQPTHPHTFQEDAQRTNVDFRLETKGRDIWVNQKPFPAGNRRPSAELPATGERFEVSGTLADDMAVLSRKSRSSAPSTWIEELRPNRWGDESRWRSRADVMLEDFLESIRPKYGSLIPTFAQSVVTESARNDVFVADKEDADLLIRKISNQLEVPDKSASLEEAKPQERESDEENKPEGPRLGKMSRTLTRLEDMLKVPQWARHDSVHPDLAYELGAIDALETTGGRGQMSDGKDKKRDESDEWWSTKLSIFEPSAKQLRSAPDEQRHLKAAFDEQVFHLGEHVETIAPRLVDRLNFMAPIIYDESKPKVDKDDIFDPETKLEGPRVGSAGQLGAEQGWLEEVGRVGLLSKEELAQCDQGLKDFNIVDQDWHDGDDQDEGDGEPLITLEGSDKASDKSSCWAEFEAHGCNTGLHLDVAEKSMGELEWKRRQKEADILALKRQKAERKAAREAKRMERHDRALKRDILASTDEKAVMVDRSQQELSQLQLHHAQFSEWTKTKVTPLLKVEVHMSRTCVHDRGYLRYLAEKGEIGQPLTDMLAWSDTENEDFDEDLKKKIPHFEDKDIGDIIMSEKGDAQRKTVSELLTQLRATPYAIVRSLAPPSKRTVEYLMASSIIMASWIRQDTLRSPFGFVWAMLLDTSLWLFEPSRADLHGITIGKDQLQFPANKKPAQPVEQMAVVAAYYVDTTTIVTEKSGAIITAVPVFAHHRRLNTIAEKTLPIKVTDIMRVTNRRLKQPTPTHIHVKARLINELIDDKNRGRETQSFGFTANTSSQNDEWYLMFNRLLTLQKHIERQRARQERPWDSVYNSFLDPPSRELSLIKVPLEADEFQLLMNDLATSEAGMTCVTMAACDLKPTFWTALKLGNIAVPPDLVTWIINNNPMTFQKPEEIQAMKTFFLATKAKMITLRSNQMGDNADLGQIAAELIADHPTLTHIDLGDNFLGTAFVTGFRKGARENAQKLGPVRIMYSVSLILSSNAFSNQDAADLVDILVTHCKKVTHLNITNCPTITLTFLPPLIIKHKELLIPRQLQPDDDNMEELNKVVNMVTKKNVLRDTLNVFDASAGATGIYVSDLMFPPRLANSVLAKALEALTCRRFALDGALGELLLIPELIQDAIPTKVHTNWSHLRELALPNTKWLSKETAAAATAHYTTKGGTRGRDSRLFMLSQLIKFAAVKEFRLSFCDDLGREVIPTQSGRFICDIITDSFVEVLDLKGCSLTPAHFQAIVRTLKERVDADSLTLGQVGEERMINLYKSGKKPVLTSPLVEDYGGIWKAWRIRQVYFDYNTIAPMDAEELVLHLVEKCPRLELVSFVGCKLTPELAASLKGVPRFHESMLRLDEDIASDKYSQIAGDYVKNRDLKLTVTQKEIEEQKARVIQKWLEVATKNRDTRKESRYRIRNNKIENFIREAASERNERGFNFKIWNSSRELGAGVQRRLTRRLGRSRTDLPDGIFPAFRPSRMMLLTMGDLGNRMLEEFEIFMQAPNDLVLDVSNCYFVPEAFESCLVTLKSVAKPYRPFLNALYMCNVGLDEFHMLDLAAMLSHYPLAVTALDLSVNRLAINDKSQLEAFQCVLQILEPRVLILDANWLLNSQEAAVLIFDLILRSHTRVLSLRLNSLGDGFATALRELLEFEVQRRGAPMKFPTLYEDLNKIRATTPRPEKKTPEMIGEPKTPPPKRLEYVTPDGAESARKKSFLKAEAVIDVLERTPRRNQSQFVESPKHTMAPPGAKKTESPKDAKKAEPTKDVKKAESGKDVKKAEPTKDAKKAEPTKDAKKAELTKDVKKAELTKDAKKAEAGKDAKKAEPTKDAKKAEAGKDAKKAEAVKDAKKAEAGKDAKKAEAMKDAKKAEATKDAKKAEAGKDAKKAELSEGAKKAETLKDVNDVAKAGIEKKKSQDASGQDSLEENLVKQESDLKTKEAAKQGENDTESSNSPASKDDTPKVPPKPPVPQPPPALFPVAPYEFATPLTELVDLERWTKEIQGRAPSSESPRLFRTSSSLRLTEIAAEPETVSSSLTPSSVSTPSSGKSGEAKGTKEAAAQDDFEALLLDKNIKEPRRRADSVLKDDKAEYIFAKRRSTPKTDPSWISRLEVLDLRNNKMSTPHLVAICRMLSILCPEIKSVRISRNMTNVDESTEIDRNLAAFGLERPPCVELKDTPLPGVVAIPTALLTHPRTKKYRSDLATMTEIRPRIDVEEKTTVMDELALTARGRLARGSLPSARRSKAESEMKSARLKSPRGSPDESEDLAEIASPVGSARGSARGVKGKGMKMGVKGKGMKMGKSPKAGKSPMTDKASKMKKEGKVPKGEGTTFKKEGKAPKIGKMGSKGGEGKKTSTPKKSLKVKIVKPKH